MEYVFGLEPKSQNERIASKAIQSEFCNKEKRPFLKKSGLSR